MRLEAQLPTRIGHAVLDRELRVTLEIQTVHGLQKEMLEVEETRTGAGQRPLEARPALVHCPIENSTRSPPRFGLTQIQSRPRGARCVPFVSTATSNFSSCRAGNQSLVEAVAKGFTPGANDEAPL